MVSLNTGSSVGKDCQQCGKELGSACLNLFLSYAV